jgi:hypothetical protein
MTEAGDGRRRAMTLPRRAAVLAPVLLGLLAPPGVLSSANASIPLRLAGTTTFTANASSVARVRIPRPASFVVDSGAQSPNITVSGDGRLVGFALMPVHREVGTVPVLLALRTGVCTQPRCRAEAPRKAFQYVDAMPDLPSRQLSSTTKQVTLPSGDYTVRAITDGAPVRMVLRLSGLTGATAVRLSQPSPVVLRTDAAPPGIAGIDPLRNVGATHQLGSDLGLTMNVVLSDFEPHVRNISGVCTYLDSAPLTGRYHPGCPGAQSESYSMVGQPTLHYYGTEISGAYLLHPGSWTRGFYVSGVGGPSSLVVTTLWMDLA